MVVIITNHKREFVRDKFIDYFDENDISHNLSASGTSQQNRVVERKKKGY